MESNQEKPGISFHEFCSACEEISATLDKENRKTLYRTYLKKWKKDFGEEEFISVFRLLVPGLERERGPYGLKQHTLAKAYIRILSLPLNGKDALKLMNFRGPSGARDGTGDFGEVIYWVLRHKCGNGSSMSVKDVNNHLENIAKNHIDHNPRGIDAELTEMIYQMTATEQKWLVRIILKEMKLGLGKGQLLSLYHPDAQELFDVSNSIQKVCSVLKDPSIRLHELEITLFQSFKPMLSERCDVNTLRLSELYYVETKLDGERFQLHYQNGQFKYFSRNGYEYTNTYGNDANSGYFTKLISEQLNPNVENCILDGEMMGWHTKRHVLVSKGQNIDVKKLRIGNIVQPCFFAFDVLLYNGQVLTNKPLLKRIPVLKDIFTPAVGVIMHTPRSTVEQNEDVLKVLNEAIDNKEEGIILKDPSSVYKPNARNAGWFKIKPEYTEGAMVELDLLIVGGYYGEGKKRGTVSHFLLGLATPKTSGTPENFEAVCRVGSGYSDDELAELCDKLSPHWIKFRPGQAPPFLHLSREKPDLWINPEKSHILQVKATEVVQSDFYHGGYSLRFVRVERIRYDKPWYDCLTTSEFHRIRNSCSGKLTAGHIEGNNTIKKKRTVKRKLQEPPQPVKRNFSNVEKLSSIFSGKEICVLSGTDNFTKQDIELMIAQHGGVITDEPSSKSFCVVLGNYDVRAKNIIGAKKHNVVDFSWVHTCVTEATLTPFNPQVLLSTTPSMMCSLSKTFDRFGDSYFEPVSLELLKSILKTVGEKNVVSRLLDEKDIFGLDQILFNGPSPFGIFRGCYAYFDIYEEVGNPSSRESICLTTERIWFLFFGGTILSSPSSASHVILHAEHLARLKQLQKLKHQATGPYKLVNHLWIVKSCASVRKMEELPFVF